MANGKSVCPLITQQLAKIHMSNHIYSESACLREGFKRKSNPEQRRDVLVTQPPVRICLSPQLESRAAPGPSASFS